MAFQSDDFCASHQLFCGSGFPYFFGLGKAKIRGAAYIEGPQVVGDSAAFPYVAGSVMIGPLRNRDSPRPFIPGAICGTNFSPYSLAVVGNAAIMNHVSVSNSGWFGQHVVAQGEVISRCGRHVLSRKKDIPFDMEHPTKPGWRLRHVCLEGPEIGVYKHGKATGNVFEMPHYWTGLVKQETITVQLTPIGQPRLLSVEKIEDNKVYVCGEEPGEYYYLLHAARYDDDLIVEYEGETHEDYPGGNEGYSFSFENDNMERIVKEVVRERLNQIETSNTVIYNDNADS